MLNKIRNKVSHYFPDKDIRNLFTHGSVSLVLQGMGLVLSYILTLTILKYSDAEGMGYYSLAMAVIVIAIMLGEMGLPSAVLRYVGQYNSEDKFSLIRSLYVQTYKVIIPVTVIIGGGIYFLAGPLSQLLFPGKDVEAALKIIYIAVPFCVLHQINLNILQGLKKIAMSEFLRNFIISVIQIIFVILGVRFWPVILVPIYAFVIASATSWGISTFYVVKKLGTNFGKRSDRFSVKKMMRTAVPMMITTYAFILMGKIDILMLGVYCPIESVGIYSVAFKLSIATKIILIAVNRIAAPTFSQLFWNGDIEKLQKVISSASRMIFWGSIPLLILLGLMPGFFMGLFGESFKTGKTALFILVLGQFFSSASGSVRLYLEMTGKQMVIRNILIIALGLNIILNYLLIPRYGIDGAAIATAATMVFWRFYGVLYVKRKCGVSIFYIPFLSK